MATESVWFMGLWVLREWRQEEGKGRRRHLMSVKLSFVVAVIPMVMAELLGHHDNSPLPDVVAMAAVWSM